MSTVITVKKLARAYKDLSEDKIASALKKLQPVSTMKYGRGFMRLYDEVQAKQIIDKYLEARKQPKKPASAIVVPVVAPAHALAPQKDMAHLIRLVEEQQDVIRKLLIGQQQVFTSVEAIARRVNSIVTELGVKE